MADEDRVLTYGDVTFEIGKLLPMEAYDVFMRHVRPLLEGAASAERRWRRVELDSWHIGKGTVRAR